ncbi:hypothetical protein GCM10010238_55100 [Streptomyces griseoviridis]|uniref:Uncharacterized protein n=1 Tax=Streptomyces griseoviridis TaxID=45398 RepID=A0A918GSA7_STRGD|nr:hypothetical protein GCM10010238_55100 [Streptomyces niveoruber]
MLDQLGFRREFLSFSESPTVDGVAQLVGDLPEHRTIARGVQPPRMLGRDVTTYSFRYLDEWASVVATVGSLVSREGRGT